MGIRSATNVISALLLGARRLKWCYRTSKANVSSVSLIYSVFQKPRPVASGRAVTQVS